MRLSTDTRVQKCRRAQLLWISHTGTPINMRSHICGVPFGYGKHKAPALPYIHVVCLLWSLFIRYLRRRNVVVNHRCTVVAKMVSQMQRALFLKAAQLYLNPNVIYLQLPGLVTITLQCGFMM